MVDYDKLYEKYKDQIANTKFKVYKALFSYPPEVEADDELYYFFTTEEIRERPENCYEMHPYVVTIEQFLEALDAVGFKVSEKDIVIAKQILVTHLLKEGKDTFELTYNIDIPFERTY